MFIAYIIVTLLTVGANIYAAAVDFRRPQWILDNISRWGGWHSWLSKLGALKAGGALGLLVGIAVPVIGVAAAVGLVLFFVGAIAVVIRARCFGASSLAGDVSPAGHRMARVAPGCVEMSGHRASRVPGFDAFPIRFFEVPNLFLVERKSSFLRAESWWKIRALH
jgi:hypothetical protein